MTNAADLSALLDAIREIGVLILVAIVVLGPADLVRRFWN
jgi:hypothetical protein